MLNTPHPFVFLTLILLVFASPLFAQPATQNPVGTAPTSLPDSLKGWKFGGTAGLNSLKHHSLIGRAEDKTRSLLSVSSMGLRISNKTISFGTPRWSLA
ncbi:MAG: hypothetical protein ACK42Y_01300 [Candidatus Thermochlorobacter sp.]